MADYYYFIVEGKKTTVEIATNRDKIEKKHEKLQDYDEFKITEIYEADGEIFEVSAEYYPEVGTSKADGML